MYICIYVYIYIYIYIVVVFSMYVYIYIYICMCIRTHGYTHDFVEAGKQWVGAQPGDAEANLGIREFTKGGFVKGGLAIYVLLLLCYYSYYCYYC